MKNELRSRLARLICACLLAVLLPSLAPFAYSQTLALNTDRAQTKPPAESVMTDLIVYDDALASGWQDWSWNATNYFTATSPVHGGTKSVSIQFNAGYAGFSVHAPTPINPSGYTAIAFWVYGGAGGNPVPRGKAAPTALRAVAQGNPLSFYTCADDDCNIASAAYNFTATAHVWTPYTVTFSALGNPGAVRRINLQDQSGAAQSVFYLDDLRIVAAPVTANLTASISINANARAEPDEAFDSRLLGSNLAAWLQYNNSLTNAVFITRTRVSGISLLRIPGGSWSDEYRWLDCEMGNFGADQCAFAEGLARPTDFINFLKATGKQAIYTMNVNATSKEAAAAVAFFNARITDTTPIGMDIRGTDWYTAGRWALLRAAHGNPEPYPIKYWEIGNEVYGAWENTWTHDGVEYVNGISGHEGYLALRGAMLAVDPTLDVSAVGNYPPAGFGNQVITAAGSVMDGFIIHPYAYYTPPGNDPTGWATILAQPQAHWSDIRAQLQASFAAYASGRNIPVYVTEFNLVVVNTQDNPNQLMTRAINAMFLADSIGQAAQTGVAMMNQWDLGTDSDPANNIYTAYGLMHSQNGWYRSPAYYVYPLWSRFGDRLLPVTSNLNAATQLSVYAGQVNTNTLSLMAINKAGAPITATITITGALGPITVTGGLVDVIQATSPASQTVTYNLVGNPADDLSNAPSLALGSSGTAVTHVFAPHSITLLRLNLGTGLSAHPNRLFLPAVVR